MLNEIFDRYGWEANIWSQSMEFKGTMRVRRGKLRRIRYEAEYIDRGFTVFMHWLAPGDDEDFEDWCRKKAPPSEYPDGTPGEATWRKKRKRNRRHGEKTHAA